MCVIKIHAFTSIGRPPSWSGTSIYICMDVYVQYVCMYVCMDLHVRAYTLGCSDFHIFSQSYHISPIPAFLRTLVFRKYQKKDCHFCHLGRIFFYFFKNLYFFRNFQNQFSKSVFNQFLQNFQGINFNK